MGRGRLMGKGRRIRTVPMPSWAKCLIDEWAEALGAAAGPILRRKQARRGCTSRNDCGLHLPRGEKVWLPKSALKSRHTIYDGHLPSLLTAGGAARTDSTQPGT